LIDCAEQQVSSAHRSVGRVNAKIAVPMLDFQGLDIGTARWTRALRASGGGIPLGTGPRNADRNGALTNGRDIFIDVKVAAALSGVD
jgi:hypothetical protein